MNKYIVIRQEKKKRIKYPVKEISQCLGLFSLLHRFLPHPRSIKRKILEGSQQKPKL